MSIYDMTDTWTDGGTTYSAIKMNATDTASASGSKLIDLQVGGAAKFAVTKAGEVQVGSNDVILQREDPNVLAMRNSTSGQELRLYHTYTSGSVYERAFARWTSNIFEIGTEHSGGVARAVKVKAANWIDLEAAGTSGLQVFSSGVQCKIALRAESYVEYDEISTPSQSSNHARVYAEDNGSGKTRLMVIFGTGAAQQIAIEP